MLTLAATAVACNRPPSQPAPRQTPGVIVVPPPGPATVGTIFVLESGGPPPDDTTVVAPAGRPRVIVLRRGAPDNSLFASVAISDSMLGDSAARARPSTDSITVRISPRPGIYGIDIEVEGGNPVPMRVAMSYAVHFVAPAGARDRYGSDLDFEQALFLARVEPDGRVVFLPTVREGSDVISARVPGPGRYVVAAPRR